MGMKETVLFGILALTSDVLALVFLRKKLFILSSLASVSVLPLVVLSGYHWRLALIDSGKDVALLGFRRYPFAPIILLVLVMVAVFCIVYSIRQHAGKKL